jgi:hypothetical protein
MKTSKALAAVALAATALAVPAIANASSLPASPTTVTCRAFAVWNSSRTTADLDRLMTASENVPWRYLGNDVTALYSDVRNGSVKYIASDVRYVAEDC